MNTDRDELEAIGPGLERPRGGGCDADGVERSDVHDLVAQLDLQVKAVKEVAKKDEPPIFHFTLYTEMLEKYRNHPEVFNVPEDVILVWPDNNDGVMRLSARTLTNASMFLS